MTRIVLTGYILVPEADLEAVKQALPEHIKNTLAESGCIFFEITPDNKDPCRFNVHEVFKDKASFEHHQERAADSEWGSISARVARYYEVTEL
jgi:quinol monooxygenase YgiN